MDKKCFIAHSVVHRLRQTMQLFRLDDIGRHQVDQFTERAHPDALPDKETLQRRHIDRVRGFHDADGAEYAHVSDPGRCARGR